MKARTAAVTAAWGLLCSSALAGCSVGVPDPAVPKTGQAATVMATPTIAPGYDAAAVAARNMTFAAGGLLPEGVPVGISDGLKDAPGWKQVKENVAGASQYRKADGCLVAAKVRINQVPLVSKDDKQSTVRLFTYLDPSILPGYLATATLRWGGEPAGPGPRAEVLVLKRPALPGARATAVVARVFGAAASSVYVSVACPDAGALATAQAEVVERLVLMPPSN